MKKEILIIVPSRSGNSKRSPNVDRFIENWKTNTEGYSDLCIALDDDDAHQYPRHSGIIYEVNPRIRMIPTLNEVAMKYKDEYKYVAFFGDDHVILNKWEKRFVENFESLNNNHIGIAYGNDLLQRQNLPTAVCLSSKIISALGYMVPEGLIHMYADNFWKDLGNSLNILTYFDDIIFEHIHPVIGKTAVDEQYLEVEALMGPDHKTYIEYLNSPKWGNDLRKVNTLLTVDTDRIETYSQHGEDIFIEDFLKLKENPLLGTFLDIGANDGVTYSNSRYFIEKYNWEAVLVEPTKLCLDELYKLYSNSNDVQIYPYAIDTTEGSSDIYVGTVDTGTFNQVSTLDEIERDYWESTRGVKYNTEKIETKTVSSLLEFSRIKNFDIVSIDTEGPDFMILEEIIKSGMRPKLIIIEHNSKAVIEKILKLCTMYEKVWFNGVNMILNLL